ncbi:MAG: 5'/3'-nucleotidase SurE [Campylobacteraceae bacterium]|nr:5'/3'-nucleotidase SurE [Campylobacteraceae bacterium]
MKHILITNDDGFDASGLRALIEALSPLAKLTIVAPAKNKSACGHSLTLDKPLRMIKIEKDFYKMDDGTPTDCIFVSLNNLFTDKNRPDLVISGINIGSNMGEDITYSGTAAGAMEAVLQGIPAISISQVFTDGYKSLKIGFNYALAKDTIQKLAKKILEGQFPLASRKFLNVNIPLIDINECKGIKITKVGHRNYGHITHKHLDPREKEYYWIGAHPLSWKESKNKDCDFEAVKANYVSVSPCHLDLTSYSDIDNLSTWIKG